MKTLDKSKIRLEKIEKINRVSKWGKLLQAGKQNNKRNKKQ